MIDLSACKTHGVTVTNVPAASHESVSEHAIALFFALRRNIVGMHDITRGGEEWVKKYSLKDEFGFCPGTCREEVVGILGGGELGIYLLLLLFSFNFISLLLSLCFLRYGFKKGTDI